MLLGQGFKEVYNLAGGIRAWEGAVAQGPVELNLDLVRGDETPVEIIKVAYGMEKTLGGFYRRVGDQTADAELGRLLDTLASIEEKHKQYLMELYLSVEPSGPPAEEFERDVDSTVMEGGFRTDEFIRTNERFLKSVPDVLDLSMMLEAQALDLYIRFSQKTANEETRAILSRIADEEKGHLTALGRLRDKQGRG